MDEIVKQAMRKWPNVPACTGWLGLDARGHWFMRDAATQARGPFAQAKGAQLQHEALAQFIGRNYGCDAQGQWFFQNGPQRVFVELEAAPWVLRVTDAKGGDDGIVTHTGRVARLQQSLVDEQGRVYLLTDLGLGLVHSQDMLAFSNRMECDARWQPSEVCSHELEARFGFVLSPAQRQAQQIQHTRE
ncbi:DUF2946 family protein [Allofranklinella schreckenbergeri]|uniref:DUF2946 family protein n=1 Tax=Allofranklinella schreckenbergeri TaxID=1076744 RepID=A0A3M6R5Q5_9BURK|nr:DUF2946 family protein [Allofranklinella schreckenbergeri]RMX10732.1 DUF2946 family protein [Allofranklinella schreckenbergeri]